MDVKPTLPTEAEIGVLEALAAQGEPLVAKAVAGAEPFRTRLLKVDPDRRWLLFDSGGSPGADAAAFAQRRLDLLVEWGEWRIAFVAPRPEPATDAGAPAIRTQFPETVSISRRRMLPRAVVPAEAAIRCVAYSGAAAIFEAEVTDVSQGGIGMVADPKVANLDPGMVLAASRLERAGREPVIVDLEVRHTARVTLEDGRYVARIGCRFVNLSPAAMKLVAEYAGGKPAP